MVVWLRTWAHIVFMVLVARSLQEKKERDAAFQKQLAFVRLEREDSKLLRVLLRFDRFTY